MFFLFLKVWINQPICEKLQFIFQAFEHIGHLQGTENRCNDKRDRAKNNFVHAQYMFARSRSQIG